MFQKMLFDSEAWHMAPYTHTALSQESAEKEQPKYLVLIPSGFPLHIVCPFSKTVLTRTVYPLNSQW